MNMDMGDEIREMLDGLEIADAREDLERAIGWTVSCDDPVSDRPATLYGFFADPVDAMRYAEDLGRDLNRPEDLGDDEPWLLLIRPILPVSDMQPRKGEEHS